MTALCFIYWAGLTFYGVWELTVGRGGGWFVLSAAGLLLIAASREARRHHPELPEQTRDG